MGEREYIMAGNYRLLDALYTKLAEAERLADKRHKFILEQQHQINDLKIALGEMFFHRDRMGLGDNEVYTKSREVLKKYKGELR